jgi:predicted ATPase
MFLKRITLLREKVPTFDRYPFSIPSIKSLHEINFEKNVPFFVGANGSGKSTLLEAIRPLSNYKIFFATQRKILIRNLQGRMKLTRTI